MIQRAEAILTAYLNADSAITALDARVAGATPGSQSRPWVRVTQLDATDDRVSNVEHLIDYLLQFDCYAGKDATDAHVGQTEALNLAIAVRVALKAAQGTTLDDVVISSVRFTGMPRIPDTDLEPARERYVLTASIHLHG